MDIIRNKDNQLTINLWILLGVCLITAILIVVGGYYSAKILIESYDEYMQEFYAGMTGGIIPLSISGIVYFSKYIIGALLVVIPINEFIISCVLLFAALLFQIGALKKWKIIISNILVGLMDIVKILYVVFLVILIYMTFKISFLIITIFLLQIIIGLIPIVLSIKLINITSYKKLKSQLKDQNQVHQIEA